MTTFNDLINEISTVTDITIPEPKIKQKKKIM